MRIGFVTDFVGTPFDTETKFSNAAGKGFAIFVFHKKMGMFASSHVVSVQPNLCVDSLTDFPHKSSCLSPAYAFPSFELSGGSSRPFCRYALACLVAWC